MIWEITWILLGCKKIKKIYTAIINGGVPPYKINRSPGTVSGINNEIMETGKNGSNVLTVSDTMGCTFIKTFETNIPNPQFENKLVNCDLRRYQFKAIVPGEKDKYTFTWNFDDGATSGMKNPLNDKKQYYFVHYYVRTGHSCGTQAGADHR